MAENIKDQYVLRIRGREHKGPLCPSGPPGAGSLEVHSMFSVQEQGLLEVQSMFPVQGQGL